MEWLFDERCRRWSLQISPYEAMVQFDDSGGGWSAAIIEHGGAGAGYVTYCSSDAAGRAWCERRLQQLLAPASAQRAPREVPPAHATALA